MDDNQNIHPLISALIKKSRKDGGIDLSDIPDGHIIELISEQRTLSLVVSDREKSEIIVWEGEHVPTRVHFRGSTFMAGSLLKAGWIGKGMLIELLDPEKGLRYFGSIQFLRFVSDPARVNEVLATTQVFPPPLREDDARLQLEMFIEMKFPEEERSVVRSLQGSFCLAAQIELTGYLASALAVGKYSEAFELIFNFYEEHWVYQSPHICGHPDYSPANTHYFMRLYSDLDIPPLGEMIIK